MTQIVMTQIIDLLPETFKERKNICENTKNEDLQYLLSGNIRENSTLQLKDYVKQSNDWRIVYENNLFKSNCLKLYKKNRKKLLNLIEKKLTELNNFTEIGIFNKIFTYLSMNDILMFE